MLDLLLFGKAPNPFTWDFRTGALPAGASFTRGSAGWYFNASGVLVQASTNVPRFDYDPATLQPFGYLTEMQSTNSIIWSADRTHWAASNVALSSDGTLGPDGSTAVLITASAGAGVHYAGNSRAAGVSAADIIGQSAFVKRGSTRYAMIVDRSDAADHRATFDFQTGAWVAAGFNATTETPRQLANGWWRLGFKSTQTNANTGGVLVAPATTGTGGSGDYNYTAAGTETVYATGLQSETPGVGITSCIPTAGSTVTRSQDILTLPLASVRGWNANAGGALVATYRLQTLVPSAPGYSQMAVGIHDGTANNMVYLEGVDGGAGRTKGVVYSGGVLQAQPDIAAADVFVRHKLAFGWSTTRIAGAVDGGPIVGSSGSFALPASPTTMDFGKYINTGQGLNGTLESITYYAGARSDDFVQQVSR